MGECFYQRGRFNEQLLFCLGTDGDLFFPLKPGKAQFDFSDFLKVPWVPSVGCLVPGSSGTLKATTISSESTSGIYQWAEIIFKTGGKKLNLRNII